LIVPGSHVVAGSVAALNYGNRVVITLLAVIGAALGSAITPYYSKMIANPRLAGRTPHVEEISIAAVFSQHTACVGAFFLVSTARPIYLRARLLSSERHATRGADSGSLCLQITFLSRQRTLEQALVVLFG